MWLKRISLFCILNLTKWSSSHKISNFESLKLTHNENKTILVENSSLFEPEQNPSHISTSINLTMEEFPVISQGYKKFGKRLMPVVKKYLPKNSTHLRHGSILKNKNKYIKKIDVTTTTESIQKEIAEKLAKTNINGREMTLMLNNTKYYLFENNTIGSNNLEILNDTSKETTKVSEIINDMENLFQLNETQNNHQRNNETNVESDAATRNDDINIAIIELNKTTNQVKKIDHITKLQPIKLTKLETEIMNTESTSDKRRDEPFLIKILDTMPITTDQATRNELDISKSENNYYLNNPLPEQNFFATQQFAPLPNTQLKPKKFKKTMAPLFTNSYNTVNDLNFVPSSRAKIANLKDDSYDIEIIKSSNYELPVEILYGSSLVNSKATRIQPPSNNFVPANKEKESFNNQFENYLQKQFFEQYYQQFIQSQATNYRPAVVAQPLHNTFIPSLSSPYRVDIKRNSVEATMTPYNDVEINKDQTNTGEQVKTIEGRQELTSLNNDESNADATLPPDNNNIGHETTESGELMMIQGYSVVSTTPKKI